MASQRSDHPVGRLSARKKAIFLATALVLLSLAAWLMQGTHAFFSDTETSTGNVFTAGVWVTPTPEMIPATVDIDPDMLNPDSEKGRFVMAYIELPNPFLVTDILVSTVTLRVDGEEGSVEAEPAPTEVGDHDEDGIPDLMIKFDRAAVLGLIGEKTGDVTLVVSGRLSTGRDFEGKDTIDPREVTVPTPTPIPTDTPAPTETPEPTETVEPSPEPTEPVEPTPTEEPTLEPTEEPTDTPTPEPTEEPTDTPIPTDTPTPTETPTPTPTSTPEPTATPTEEPTVTPEGEGGQG